MKRFLIPLLIVLAGPALAQVEGQTRIQDLSMTPEETSKAVNDPNIFPTTPTRQPPTIPPINGTPPINASTAPMPQQSDVEPPPSKSFMADYCDPNFTSIWANNQKYFGQEACLKQLRDNTCGRFKILPDEVRTVLDDAIGCLFANGNGYAVDKNQKVSNDSVDCGASYMRRIEMLKKYYNDYYTNNALLFLPDDVLDTAGRCVNRNEGQQPRLVK